MKYNRYTIPIIVIMILLSGSKTLAAEIGYIENDKILIRLCPVSCQIVPRGSYKTGDQVTLYENKEGWTRITRFIKKEKLKEKFGDDLPTKPALWVPTDSLKLISTSKKTSKKVAKRKNVTLPIKKTPLKKRPSGKTVKIAKVEKIEEPEIIKTQKEIEEERINVAKLNAEKKIARAKAEATGGVDNTPRSSTVPKRNPRRNSLATQNTAKSTVPKNNPRKNTRKNAQGEEIQIAAVDNNETAQTLNLGQRPQNYTKELNDGRLEKLPSPKNKNFSANEVIAIRHHALMLLRNNECNGVLDGGRSLSQKGWLYVVCEDDPSYLRQFPLEEVTW